MTANEAISEAVVVLPCKDDGKEGCNKVAEAVTYEDYEVTKK